jgi:hypothetical protein
MDGKMKKNDRNGVRKITRARRIFKAQGLVEFALILPVILITIFVLVELARVLHAWLSIENGARAGIRYAVTAEYNPDYCPASVCATEGEEFEARVASIHDAAWAGSSSIVRVGFGEADPDEVSYFNVVVCDPEKLVAPASTFDSYTCESDVTSSGEDPGAPGQPVVVVVEFNHPLLTPLLTSVWPELRLDAKRQANVETYRIPLPVGTAPAFNSPTPKPTNTPLPTNTPPGPVKPPDCDFVHFWLTGNQSEGWVKAYVAGYPTDEEPPGATYEMNVTQVRVGHGTGPSPTLKTFTWETWGEMARKDTLNEEGYFIYTPDPSYHVAHCYPGGCSDYHFKGTLLANFNIPLTELTSMRLQVEFPDFPTIVCSAWVSYAGEGYVPDTPGPYISDTPNPNPPTKTPTTVWYPPTATWTPDTTSPDD